MGGRIYFLGAHIDAKKKIAENANNLLTDEFGKIFKYDENSHRFSFADPFYRVFAKAYLENKDNSLSRRKMNNDQIISLINEAFNMVKRQFSESQTIINNIPGTPEAF